MKKNEEKKKSEEKPQKFSIQSKKVGKIKKHENITIYVELFLPVCKTT